jgi:hypothetical protein
VLRLELAGIQHRRNCHARSQNGAWQPQGRQDYATPSFKTNSRRRCCERRAGSLPTTDGAELRADGHYSAVARHVRTALLVGERGWRTPDHGGPHELHDVREEARRGFARLLRICDNDNDPVDGDTQLLRIARPTRATATIVARSRKYDGFRYRLIPALRSPTFRTYAILKNGSSAAIQSTGAGLFYLNGELWAYETKTDNGDGTYTLNNAHRALLDTAPVASAAGDTLYFFDGQEGFWDTLTLPLPRSKPTRSIVQRRGVARKPGRRCST